MEGVVSSELHLRKEHEGGEGLALQRLPRPDRSNRFDVQQTRSGRVDPNQATTVEAKCEVLSADGPRFDLEPRQERDVRDGHERVAHDDPLKLRDVHRGARSNGLDPEPRPLPLGDERHRGPTGGVVRVLARDLQLEPEERRCGTASVTIPAVDTEARELLIHPPPVDGDEFELGYGLTALTGLGVVGSRHGEAGTTFHPRRRLPSTLGEGERAPQPTTLDRHADWGCRDAPTGLGPRRPEVEFVHELARRQRSQRTHPSTFLPFQASPDAHPPSRTPVPQCIQLSRSGQVELR